MGDLWGFLTSKAGKSLEGAILTQVASKVAFVASGGNPLIAGVVGGAVGGVWSGTVEGNSAGQAFSDAVAAAASGVAVGSFAVKALKQGSKAVDAAKAAELAKTAVIPSPEAIPMGERLMALSGKMLSKKMGQQPAVIDLAKKAKLVGWAAFAGYGAADLPNVLKGLNPPRAQSSLPLQQQGQQQGPAPRPIPTVDITEHKISPVILPSAVSAGV
ncbi:hypothetical protein ACFXO9_30865 [Nocardia tengchongensis]|uniref:hypothetical protein n=1 Tax=Nocardia tengchongensis TaxID=2055889 RepID=UPI0036CACE9B